jgi:thiamine-phosphate pyrophosphorylase
MRVARLHLITPDGVAPLPGDRVERATVAALDAGARWVQVRAKHGTDRERWAITRELTRRCLAVGAACVVNDRADLALTAGAHGAHLGLDDVPVAALRTVVLPSFVIGATARNPDQARRAVDAGADYLGVGPVFATTTKTGLPDPIGLRGLEAVTSAVDVPVVAISGITPERVEDVLAAGAHGVAVVAAVYGAADPGAATRELLDALGVDGADDGELQRPSGGGADEVRV